MKTGVLVHGYNIHSSNWQEVVWWKNPDSIGKLPQAAKIISLIKPELVIFGSGASRRDGKTEAEIMRNYLLEHFTELAVLGDFFEIDLKKLCRAISSISQLEFWSENTFQEIKYSACMFKAAGVESIISVSSPDHASRCMANAMEIFSEDRKLSMFLGNFSTWPSQVPYGRKGEWPVVVESPHRFYPALRKIMTLPKKE